MSETEVNYRFRSDRGDLWYRFKDHVSKNETVSAKIEELIERYVTEQEFIQSRDDLDEFVLHRTRAELEAYHAAPDDYADQHFPVGDLDPATDLVDSSHAGEGEHDR